MSGHRSHLLSIAPTPTAAEIVEAKRAGQGVQVLRRSTLVFAPGAGLDAPAALGQAIGEHLKQNGYGTKHAVVGELRPRWVLARQQHVPPADTDALRGIVNLQIEREFAGSASDLSFDYLLGEQARSESQAPLLLAAVRKAVLIQIGQAAQVAGLHLEAITPTTFAARHPSGSGTTVVVESGVAGVMRLHNGVVLGLASCSADVSRLNEAAGRERLLADLSRCALQLPSSESADRLTLILPASVSASDAQALTQAAADRFGEIETRQADPAELLAEQAMRPGEALVNFNASRLAPPKVRPLVADRDVAGLAAVLVLLIGGTAGYLWYDATTRRDDLQAEYDLIKDKAQELSAIRADTRLAEGWFDERLPTLDVLRELTRTFPTDGQIRVETLTMQSNLDCQIECTAEDRKTMDRYFTQIQDSAQLLKVDPGSVRPSGGKGDWIDFPIEFRFDPSAKGGRP